MSDGQIPFGEKLAALIQRDLYKGIKKANLPTPRTSTETYLTDPIPSTIWRMTKHKKLTKKTRESICSKCDVEESTEHILMECNT